MVPRGLYCAMLLLLSVGIVSYASSDGEADPLMQLAMGEQVSLNDPLFDFVAGLFRESNLTADHLALGLDNVDAAAIEPTEEPSFINMDGLLLSTAPEEHVATGEEIDVKMDLSSGRKLLKYQNKFVGDKRDGDHMVKEAKYHKPVPGWGPIATGKVSNFGGPWDGMWGDTPKDGTLVGGCGYGLIPMDRFPYWHVGSFDFRHKIIREMMPSLGCGSCWLLTCTGSRCTSTAKPVVFQVTDNCPTCDVGANQIDIEYKTWLNAGGVPDDNFEGVLQRVNCQIPAGSTAGGNVWINVLDHTNTWTRLVPHDVMGLGVVKSVALNCDKGYFPGNNEWGTVFEFATHKAMGSPGKCSFEICQEDGTCMKTAKTSLYKGARINTGAQFPLKLAPGKSAQPAASSYSSADGCAPKPDKSATPSYTCGDFVTDLKRMRKNIAQVCYAAAMKIGVCERSCCYFGATW